MLLKRSPSPRRVRLQLEQLETREVPAGFNPTAAEQLFLERLNDARADPAAYGQSIGLDLSNVPPSEPLAWDTRLVQAARLHSQDMNGRNFFAHTNPDGVGPSGRISAAGFNARSWGESIAAGYSGPEAALRALVVDDGVPSLGHRRHLLAIDSSFRGQNLVGIGVVENGSGTYHSYFTIDSAEEFGSHPYLTGVVYNDLNRNGRYDSGEGLGGVTVSVQGGPSTVTFATGGYSLGLNAGSYTVTFSGGGLGAAVTRNFTVGSLNVRMDATAGSASTPQQPPANGGDAAWLAQTYQSLLHRAPGQADNAYWLGQLQGGLSRDGAIVAISASPEYVSVQGRAWLTLVYQALLNRAPGTGDFTYWLGVLQGGASRQAVVASIMSSQEHRSVDNLRWLTQAYQNMLGRGLTANDINYWLGVLNQGTTRPQALASIALSEEFNRGLSGTFGGWLDRVYQRVLGRSAGADGLGYWGGVAGSGAGRYDIALAIAGSPEAQRRESAAWVGRLYRDLLGREGGASGIDYWLFVMQQGASRAAVVGSFVTSPEFINRVANS